MDIGEEWAYRARQLDEVTKVRIMRVGTNRPPRVLIRFMEDRFEGREEWVSPARLKTTWDKVDEWVANDQRWTAIRDASWRNREDPELRAAEMVLEVENLPLDCISTGYNRDNGILFINDVAELSRVLGLDPTELTSDPTAFENDDGTWVVPFATTLVVAKQAASVFADEVLTEVEEAETKARQEAIHGSYYRSSRDDGYIEPEICIEVDKMYAPARQLVRGWCGHEAAERLTELVALRAEVFRLGKLVERAITELGKWDRATADGLERELGFPIETLRHSRRRDHH
ncbi:hypothetical protein ACSHWB_26265 [Lentzea sp. HUAS TT2]|uniref:hypothetical protein n=1 Tax=Lentzea sp. HUAS TT2 TaxID=3447454 RepID=UPI003F6F5844